LRTINTRSLFLKVPADSNVDRNLQRRRAVNCERLRVTSARGKNYRRQGAISVCPSPRFAQFHSKTPGQVSWYGWHAGTPKIKTGDGCPSPVWDCTAF